MVYPQQLTVQLRQKQLIDIYGNNGFYTGANPLSLAWTLGTITNPWQDFTDFCDGLQKISLSWSVQQSANGDVAAGNFVPKKGVSGSLTFERDAYDFIKSLLVDNVAAVLNQIEVQITDTSCGAYVGYVITPLTLSWCEFDALCTYECNLKQEDEATQCIQRTMIADNWQGWFQNTPVDAWTGAAKFHPRFSYCIEHRPNAVLILEWMLTSLLAVIFTIVYTVFYPILLVIHALISIINTIISAINALPGISISLIPNPTPATPGTVMKGWANMMLESAGCGREHHAPLIRDYISNVCDKCGIQYNASSIDIFFAPMLTITRSDGVLYTEPNEHYNACLFWPQVNRGVRRFKHWDFLTGSLSPDTTTYYDPGNQPVWALSDMLDALKKEYNAQWQVKNTINPATGALVSTLFFKRKDWFYDQPPLYDFSIGGADRSKLTEGICYQPQEFTVPASCNGLYQDDPSDHCGHEAAQFYNGDPLSFNNTSVNALFYGILDKKSGFAPTKFNCDGASTNYLYDALQACWSLTALTGFLSSFALSDLSDFISRYADYAILLQTEQVSLPKIIIWDGKESTTDTPFSINPYLNARAIKDQIVIAGTNYFLGKSGYPGTVPGITTPDVNPLYPVQQPPPSSLLFLPTFTPNTIAATAPNNFWEFVNGPQTTVIGRIGGFTPPNGKYQVQDYFGTVEQTQAAILVNYPMYFTPYFKGTMWDRFHWIDDPYKYPLLHKNWSLKIPLCCEDIKKLGVLGDGSNAALQQSILLDATYYNTGVITEIEACYETGDDGKGSSPGTGQYMKISGYV